MLGLLLDVVVPRRCLVCRLPGGEVCDGCRERLQPAPVPLCHRCGAHTPWPVERCRECAGRRLAFAQARAGVLYDDVARTLVGAWKERGLRRLGLLAGEVVAELLTCPPVDALTFVPPDGDRSLKRGHHPAERLARELGLWWKLPVEPLLGRAREVKQQRGLSVDERRRNVQGAFEAVREPPRRLCLIDDVYTTGSTVSAAASALRRRGARHVEVVTFARAVR
jgi:predicted amidophosphoribosyltransferase